MSVGRHGPAEVFLYVGGYDLTAAKLDSLRHKDISMVVPVRGLGDSWVERSPTGLQEVELEQQGAFFDTRALNSHDALKTTAPTTAQAAPRVVSFGMAGKAIGDAFFGLEGAFHGEYQVVVSAADLHRANTAYHVSGRSDKGQILQPLEAKTADWNTEAAGQVDYTLDTAQRVVPITSSSVANPSVITCPVPHGLTTGQRVLIAGHSGSTPSINGEHVATVISATTFSIPVNVTGGGTGGTLVQADSMNGGAAYLQVTAFSGFSGFVGKVRHSVDDVTYADLVTFNNVTAAPAAQRSTVAGNVRRYLAFDGNVTGSGSITVFCGFARQ